MRPEVVLIAACDADGGIGLGGSIPWNHPEDFRRFRAATMGAAVIVGRLTLKSLPAPLRGRTVVAVSGRPGDDPRADLWAGSLDEALAAAGRAAPGGRAFVAGGARLYAEAEPLASEALLTRVPGSHGCDRHFPGLAPGRWRLAASDAHGVLEFQRWVRPPSCA